MNEHILPGAVVIDDGTLVRCGDRVVGRVIAIKEHDEGINIGLQIDDKAVYEALMYGTAGFVHALPAKPAQQDRWDERPHLPGDGD